MELSKYRALVYSTIGGESKDYCGIWSSPHGSPNGYQWTETSPDHREVVAGFSF